MAEEIDFVLCIPKLSCFLSKSIIFSKYPITKDRSKKFLARVG